MATYSNQHWLLSHIRNSFVSTDDTGICETVMLSDDLPKHFLRKYQTEPAATLEIHQRKSSSGGNSSKVLNDELQEVDFVCYPGLDQSDDEEVDISSQSFDIQMYPGDGAHRFRSNTAQKLDKMDLARRKAARTKCINFDDEIIPPEDNEFFVKKPIASPKIDAKHKTEQAESVLSKAFKKDTDTLVDTGIRSKLTLQLANSPKQTQNKFMEFARFDGTSQTGIQTKRINVFLSMLPQRERNYPIKICVLASAKILEVIGLVCYKATVQFPDIPLKSIRHYALYMTEDNDDMEDFPPLDNREPCSKFGFSQLTLAERRPLVPVTRIDYNNTLTKSTVSEEERARLTADAVRSLQGIKLTGGKSDEEINEFPIPTTEEHITDDYKATFDQMDMLEAPLYRTYRLNIIDKRFFKTEVTLGISGERIEIDQQKNAKFWSKQKAVSFSMESVAHCEIVERRNTKATVRIYLRASSSSSPSIETRYAAGSSSNTALAPHSPTSPGHSSHMSSSPFNFLHLSMPYPHHHMRFKHYDFETTIDIAEHILKKLKCILEVRTSDVRREFLNARERKLEKQSKKHLKL